MTAHWRKQKLSWTLKNGLAERKKKCCPRREEANSIHESREVHTVNSEQTGFAWGATECSMTERKDKCCLTGEGTKNKTGKCREYWKPEWSFTRAEQTTPTPLPHFPESKMESLVYKVKVAYRAWGQAEDCVLHILCLSPLLGVHSHYI